MPGEGSIKVDGIDTRFLAANELRQTYGVVPQETVLFSGTVYDNLIAAAHQASFQDVETACRMAEIHEHIQGLPQGYQTEIGEKGAGLSGGQKQRIAIATCPAQARQGADLRRNHQQPRSGYGGSIRPDHQPAEWPGDDDFHRPSVAEKSAVGWGDQDGRDAIDG
jgi:hypothetical protein